MLLAQDPISGLWCREDGKVLMPPCPRILRHTYEWVSGSVNNRGYPIIMIQHKHHQVHRIIARAFLPNPGGLPTVDHIDRNRQNNSVDNLRWADYKTQADNTRKVDRCIGAYGVRWCEDMKAYAKAYNAAYNAAHKAEKKVYCTTYRAVQKAKGFVQRKCSDGKLRWVAKEHCQ